MAHDLVFTRPAGDLKLQIRLRWLGQNAAPHPTAADWPSELDNVALVASIEAFDADGTRVLPSYWPGGAPAGWERYENGVTRGERGPDAQTLENNARQAVSNVIAGIDAVAGAREARRVLREQRRKAAGVPTWVESAAGPRNDRG